MSASLVRCCCRTREKLFKISRHTTQIRELSIKKRGHVNTLTVPYFKTYDSLKEEYPDVELSQVEFKYVDRLISPTTVPPPPKHSSYPTPSGWYPPNPDIQPTEYNVRRTRNHMLPVYLVEKFSGRIYTKINHLEGDILKCHADLIEELNLKPERTQVCEIGMFIRIKGDKVQRISQFMQDKGF